MYLSISSIYVLSVQDGAHRVFLSNRGPARLLHVYLLFSRLSQNTNTFKHVRTLYLYVILLFLYCLRISFHRTDTIRNLSIHPSIYIYLSRMRMCWLPHCVHPEPAWLQAPHLHLRDRRRRRRPRLHYDCGWGYISLSIYLSIYLSINLFCRSIYLSIKLGRYPKLFFSKNGKM